ncbi:MAG TPA: SDR family NAD(P)-dependent oxidoreductase [Polyangiales bacterium]|nr:SDR family NAD(P)-dependent oxidoreductase [Polyangiales bacterium]
MSASKRVAIFGATSAIAQSVARRYARAGAQLALIGRNQAKLEALARELGPAARFTRVQDFARTEQAEAGVQAAFDALGGIDIALIAHGLLGDQLRSEQELAEALEIEHVNYTSVVALLIPIANRLAAQQSGQIAVLSTVAAERGRPRNYTYAAAKGALNVYLQGLRSRLYREHVTVHTLKLGPTDTPMSADHTKNMLFARPDQVADGVVRAIERGDQEAYVPRFWRPLMFVVRNLPEPIFQRVPALSGR